jgi:hypothetical protein
MPDLKITIQMSNTSSNDAGAPKPTKDKQEVRKLHVENYYREIFKT